MADPCRSMSILLYHDANPATIRSWMTGILLVASRLDVPRTKNVVEPQKERPTTNAYLTISQTDSDFDLTTPLTSIYISTIRCT